jgi:DICT domain-containing protein
MAFARTDSLYEIVDGVHTESKTVRALNVTDEDRFRAVEEYLARHDVDIVREDGGTETDVLVVESDGETLARDSIRSVERFAEAPPAAGYEDARIPPVVEHLDDTRFQSYDKRQMILASRIGEFRAWNRGSGELHAGFQRLSKVDFQRAVYEQLQTSDVDVHVYGVDDWDRTDEVDMHVHVNGDDEVYDHWWVVYDGDGHEADKYALIAQEQSPSEWFGFWTYGSSTVDRLLDRMPRLQ